MYLLREGRLVQPISIVIRTPSSLSRAALSGSPQRSSMASGGVLGGIDIGGSSVKVGLVRSTDGSVVERVHHAITDRDPNAIVELASAALEKLLSSVRTKCGALLT